jgi:hypothetical protein
LSKTQCLEHRLRGCLFLLLLLCKHIFFRNKTKLSRTRYAPTQLNTASRSLKLSNLPLRQLQIFSPL